MLINKILLFHNAYILQNLLYIIKKERKKEIQFYLSIKIIKKKKNRKKC